MIADNTAAGFGDSNDKTLVDEDIAKAIDFKSPRSKILFFSERLSYLY